MNFGKLLNLGKIVTHPELIPFLTSFYTKFKQMIDDAKVGFQFEKRPYNGKDLLHLVIQVESPNQAFHDLLTRFESNLLDIEKKYGQIFLGDSIKIVVEIKNQKTYYLRG